MCMIITQNILEMKNFRNNQVYNKERNGDPGRWKLGVSGSTTAQLGLESTHLASYTICLAEWWI